MAKQSIKKQSEMKNRDITQRKSFKQRRNDKCKAKNHNQNAQTKVLYKKKFSFPLRRKPRNGYDPVEEARLEKIVFGNPSDIISNLSNNTSVIHTEANKKPTANKITRKRRLNQRKKATVKVQKRDRKVATSSNIS